MLFIQQTTASCPLTYSTHSHRHIKFRAEAMKKQNSHVFLISLFVLLLASPTSARLLVPKLVTDQETTPHEINLREIDIEHLTNLMGSEECAEKDEGCLERRMIAEAHLDYIYTQHHKP